MSAQTVVYTCISHAHERRVAAQHGYPRRCADDAAEHASETPRQESLRVVSRAGSTARAPFDLTAFKAEWRALAAERGVDPVNGANAFQAAAQQAAFAEQARAEAPDADWWAEPQLWRYAGPYRSTVEEAAIDALFDEAGGIHMAAKGRLAAARKRQGPAVHRGYDGSQLRPLREVLAAQGQQLSFVTMDDGGTLSFVVPRVGVGLTEARAGLG